MPVLFLYIVAHLAARPSGRLRHANLIHGPVGEARESYRTGEEPRPTIYNPFTLSIQLTGHQEEVDLDEDDDQERIDLAFYTEGPLGVILIECYHLSTFLCCGIEFVASTN